MRTDVKLNQYGFYTLTKVPSKKELEDYYANKYYQADTHRYKHRYSEKEIQYFYNKIEQKHKNLLHLDLISTNQRNRLLDVGCGEGFTLKYFKKAGWDVTGLDYSDFGCRMINPDCVDNLIQGDVDQNISQLLEKGEKFDLIWLDNVLEHLIDPLKTLQEVKALTNPSGALVIEVPNDFSIVQNALLESEFIDDPFWIVSPDHISYFNKKGLINLCDAAGWDHKMIIGDFPIDFFLFNNFSNYKKQKETGKQAHKARIEIENLLHELPTDKVNHFYHAMADLGIGRQLIGFFKNTD
ncbi:MAG: class I SAM-dependent methyltransferase [Bacteroidota bacterium]